MPSEREYLLRVYIGQMQRLGDFLKFLPEQHRVKALLVHESITNYLESLLEQEKNV